MVIGQSKKKNHLFDKILKFLWELLESSISNVCWYLAVNVWWVVSKHRHSFDWRHIFISYGACVYVVNENTVVGISQGQICKPFVLFLVLHEGISTEKRDENCTVHTTENTCILLSPYEDYQLQFHEESLLEERKKIIHALCFYQLTVHYI